MCILGLGLIGLLAVYSGRDGIRAEHSASVNDSLRQEGKLRSEHMIIRLNQRSKLTTGAAAKVTSF